MPPTPVGSKKSGPLPNGRGRPIAWLNGLIETEDNDADVLIVTSGTAVSQGREAIRLLADEDIQWNW